MPSRARDTDAASHGALNNRKKKTTTTTTKRKNNELSDRRRKQPAAAAAAAGQPKQRPGRERVARPAGRVAKRDHDGRARVIVVRGDSSEAKAKAKAKPERKTAAKRKKKKKTTRSAVADDNDDVPPVVTPFKGCDVSVPKDRRERSDVSLPSLKRIARRSGVEQMQADILPYMRQLTVDFVDAVCRNAQLYTHAGDSERHSRVTVTKKDTQRALEHMGYPLYG